MENPFDSQLLGSEGPNTTENSSIQANAEGDMDDTMGPFGLPHHLVEKIILEPYDASWVLKYDVDAASVHVKTADANTMRFRDLFHAGALHIGDEIYHHGSYEMNGQRVELEKVARVVGNSKDAGGRKYPSLVVLSGGVYIQDLPVCRGPKEIAIIFNQILPQELPALKEIGSWRQLRVRRANLDLGSIHDVRNALFAWRREMDVWASAHKVSYRSRRTKRSKPAASQYASQDENGGGVGQGVMSHASSGTEEHLGTQANAYQQTINPLLYQQAAPETARAGYCGSCGQAMPATVLHSLRPYGQMRTAETSEGQHYCTPQAMSTGYYTESQGLSEPSSSQLGSQDSFLGQLYAAIQGPPTGYDSETHGPLESASGQSLPPPQSHQLG